MLNKRRHKLISSTEAVAAATVITRKVEPEASRADAQTQTSPHLVQLLSNSSASNKKRIPSDVSFGQRVSEGVLIFS